MRNSPSKPVESSETVQLLIRCSNDIRRMWLDQLKEEWGEDGASKVALLAHEQEDQKDLLSIIISQMSGSAEDERKGREAVVDRVRGENYSVEDFLIEIERLENCTEEVLKRIGEGSAIQTLEVLNHVGKRLRALLLTTMQETCGVYEKIFDSVARGVCLFNANRTIVAANSEMKRLLDTRSATGRQLESVFDANDRTLLQEILLLEKTGKPRMFRSHLLTDRGALIPVGVEIAPKYGYLCAVDLSSVDRMEKEIYDEFPLAVTEQTLKSGEFTYMNATALRLLGLESWEGITLRDILPDDENYSQVLAELETRHKGSSDVYRVKVTRQSDLTKIPVSIAAVPEEDFQGNIIRSLAIIRDLTVEDASEKIHRYVADIGDPEEMLSKIVSVVLDILPFDRLVITLYSADMTHSRTFYCYDRMTGRMETKIRWWPIPSSLMEMTTNRQPFRVDSIEDWLNQPGNRDMKTLPEFVKLLQEGFQSFLSYPVKKPDRLLGGISLLSKKEKAYGKEQESMFEKLPLDKAVLMALHDEQMRELEFRLELVQKIMSACDDKKKVAETIVEELADKRPWEHISLFRVDEKNRQFSLLQQKALSGTHSLIEPFKLDFGKGVLTHVYSTKEAVNIPNVREDPAFRGIYEPALSDTLSELCLPIFIGGKVCWLMNIEDSHQNAFSKEEMDALLGIVKEIEHLLDRVWMHHFLRSLLDSTSDIVLVTDRQGKISLANQEAMRQLGYEQDEMTTLTLKDIFADPEAAKNVIEATICRTSEIKLRHNDGSLFPVLLSGSELPEDLDFEGKIFVCKDMSVFERVKELEYLKTMYHEIAVQTQTPLSLAFGWIQSLGKATRDKGMAETLDKALKQLKKVEMTYSRLALYDKEEGLLPYTEVLLSISEVVDYVLSEFPRAERDRITDRREPKLPYLRGDLFQLTFCFEAILSFLLRYLPLNEKIDLRISSQNGWVITKIAGFLPDLGTQRPGEPGRREALSKNIMQMALGDEMINKFVDNHKGKFFKNTGRGSQGWVEIHLPVARGEA